MCHPAYYFLIDKQKMNMQIFNNLFHLNFLSFECEKKSSGGLRIRKCFQELHNIYRKQRRIQQKNKQTTKIVRFAKIVNDSVNYFRKRHHLRCLSGFCMLF